MSGVAMEALTLPAAESQFQPFCRHFYVQSQGDDLITIPSGQKPDSLDVC